jgi:predicted transcriptional regulator
MKMDKALLEYEMNKRGVTINNMCTVLGISRSAFYRKCNGISEFTLSEIKKIIDFLEIDSPMEIFFAEKVS